MHSHIRRGVVLASALLVTLPVTTARSAVTPFTFVTNASTSGLYASSGAGGDLRLDSVVINGTTYLPAQLQTVNGATIVVDNGYDPRGGHILAAGRGIGSTGDAWTTEGAATVTPTGADLQSAQANFNLSSITVTREVLGTTFVTYTFASPTNTFLYWERGVDSDATVEALDANHNVVDVFKVRRQDETATGYFVSTENSAFNISNQQLGSIGFQFSQPISELAITSLQVVAGGGGPEKGDGGPDYKILAIGTPIAAVPEPASAMTAAALVSLAASRRRRHRLRR